MMATSATRASAPALLTTSQPQPSDGGSKQQRPSHESHRRTRTNTAEIDNTISHPGSVKINVEGAFIVDRDSTSPHRSPVDGANHETTDIRLPNHTAVVSHIAVDIGGSLAKLVYFSREPPPAKPGGRLNFMSFETDRIDDCIKFMQSLKDKQQALNGSRPGELCVMATGGGAFKYYDKIRQALGVDVLREDEMECLIIGLDFFITEIPREVFTYSEADPMAFAEPTVDIYPYLLVNIGSGVSMIKVSGPRDFQRVGGTSLGGGTLWGLLSLLTGARTFDDMLGMAERGDNSKVDMLVGDIYGTDYGKIGLKSTTIASSFGKVFRMKKEAEQEAEDTGGHHNDDDSVMSPRGSLTLPPTELPLPAEPAAESEIGVGPAPAPPLTKEEFDYPSPMPSQPQKSADDYPSPLPRSIAGINLEDQQLPGQPPFNGSDISRSLLYAISNNIGQIAYLQSSLHNLPHIYFGGSFIRGHRQTMNTLSYAIKFWSKGEKKAYFLRHEGYLGAVGAFLKRQPKDWGRRGSFDAATSRPFSQDFGRSGEDGPSSGGMDNVTEE